MRTLSMKFNLFGSLLAAEGQAGEGQYLNMGKEAQTLCSVQVFCERPGDGLDDLPRSLPA